MTETGYLSLQEKISKSSHLKEKLKEAGLAILDNCYESNNIPREEAHTQMLEAFEKCGIEPTNPVRYPENASERRAAVRKLFHNTSQKYIPVMLCWMDTFHADEPYTKSFYENLDDTKSNTGRLRFLRSFVFQATIAAAAIVTILVGVPQFMDRFLAPQDSSKPKEPHGEETSASPPNTGPEAATKGDEPDGAEELNNASDSEEPESSLNTGDQDAPSDTGLTPVGQGPQARVVNATWDRITAQAWATWEYRNFYSAIRSTDKAELLAAAEGGNKNAQALAAIGYYGGIIERNNHTKAARMARLACDQRQALGCKMIAEYYARGLAYPQNMAKAYQLHRQACSMGNQISCFEAGWRLAHGVATKANFSVGHNMIKDSCNAGYGRACMQYASYFLFGDEVPNNEELGQRYLAKACNLGFSCSKTAFRVTGQEPVPQ